MTLKEIEQRTGIPIFVLKKHVQRGKLVATRKGRRLDVSDADLDAYLASEEIAKTVERVRGKPLEVVLREFRALVEKVTGTP